MNRKTKLARRNFLLSGSSAALGLASVSAMAATSLSDEGFSQKISQCLTRLSFSECYSLENSVASDFIPLIGSDFVVNSADRSTVLTLKKVYTNPLLQTGKGIPAHIRKESFGLIFTGKNGANLTSSIHELQHSQLGTLTLFVSPFGLQQDGEEKTFNVVFA